MGYFRAKPELVFLGSRGRSGLRKVQLEFCHPELSEDLFDTLTQHAVPLDYRVLAALKHSALALDIYTWLAHLLPRIHDHRGTKVSWANLKDQFGQDYGRSKDFKKAFRKALWQVCRVYPDARLHDVMGGLLLRPSHSPVPRTQILIDQPK